MGKIILIILIIGIVLGGLVFILASSTNKSSQGSVSSDQTKSDIFKKPSEVKEIIASVAPSKTPDFVKDGNLRFSEGDPEIATWKLIYEEPGRMALNADLKLNNRSVCNFGSGEGICSEKHFENGMRVNVEGYKNGDQLTVVKLKVLPE